MIGVFTRWFKWKKAAAHLRTGRAGELRAARFLKKSKIKILARNVRVGRDEIDLIARDGETLVFVEVKTRRTEDFGAPVSAVDKAKRRKLRPPYIRFDVVEVILDPPEIRHLKNVFTLEGGYQIRW